MPNSSVSATTNKQAILEKIRLIENMQKFEDFGG
jgi:hypothetical protein